MIRTADMSKKSHIHTVLIEICRKSELQLCLESNQKRLYKKVTGQMNFKTEQRPNEQRKGKGILERNENCENVRMQNSLTQL